MHYAKSLFDKKKDYDDKRDKYYFERRVMELDKILSELNERSSVLDIGCGTGITIDHMKSKGFEMFGVDISKTLLKVASGKKIGNLCLVEEIELPFKNRRFDFITMFDVIEHMDNYPKNLNEIHRILKPGGLVFISYPNPSMIWLLDIMARLGLKIPGKENKVPMNGIKANISGTFRIKKFKPIVLVSKLPSIILKIFETLETLLPKFILKRIALSYVVVLERL